MLCLENFLKIFDLIHDFSCDNTGLELMKSVKPSLKTKATAFEIPSDIYKI